MVRAARQSSISGCRPSQALQELPCTPIGVGAAELTEHLHEQWADLKERRTLRLVLVVLV